MLSRVNRHGYIAAMRRRSMLVGVGAVLVIGVGAYSVFWWIAAGRIKEEAAKWYQRTLDIDPDVPAARQALVRLR